mmetsp:Transcript_36397/g.77426  ORF Transcript_36397/g.77426 Transcript_36397/m.77426 type:complete len:352 (+) Transcript_36397:208-1263(+)
MAMPRPFSSQVAKANVIEETDSIKPSKPKVILKKRSDCEEKHSAQKQDHVVAAMLLRDAKTRAERAEEEGMGAFLTEDQIRASVNERLLKGELSQARSHNIRCGIQPLPKLASGQHGQAVSTTLESEFFKSVQQHQEALETEDRRAQGLLIEAGPQKKRQRLGGGAVLDLEFAHSTAEALAEEDVALSNPLLRPPTQPKKRQLTFAEDVVPDLSRRPIKRTTSKETQLLPEEDANVLWPSNGLRVRVVDESGRFKKHHMKKCVVSRRSSANRVVDLVVDGSGEVLQSVPQDVLETVVSKACSRVEVVRGPHRGCQASLVKRSSRENLAVIRLDLRGGSDLSLKLDDVCEFV